MEIIPLSADEKTPWNAFINRHYPPVGAFMQSWEWGSFQKTLGRDVQRYLLTESHTPIAAFSLVSHTAPLGLSYGYMPRGPVLAGTVTEERIGKILNTIRRWAVAAYPHLAFIRMEPPIASIPGSLKRGFALPRYYVQPKFNLAVPLYASIPDIIGNFHPSTRSNIRRAERRGVTVKITSHYSESDVDDFFAMAHDTIARNSGKNVYPTRAYFRSLLKTILHTSAYDDPNCLSAGIFRGYQHDALAAMHIVLFFSGTATYLYGASHSRNLPSKVTTYLHWAAMEEAKRRGLHYYDIGGIDDTRWPTLTAFKRQFNGEEFAYAGNIDILIHSGRYRIYNAVRRLRKSLLVLIITAALMPIFFHVVAFAQSREELTVQLQQMEMQIAEYEHELSQTRTQKQTLTDKISALRKQQEKIALQIKATLLKDNGAATGGTDAEWRVAMLYFSGSTGTT